MSDGMDLKPYISQPTKVLAYQWHPQPEDTDELPPAGVFSEFNPYGPPVGSGRVVLRYYVVTAHEQKAYLEPGDWIVQEPDGVHYYPVKDYIFRERYVALKEPKPSIMVGLDGVRHAECPDCRGVCTPVESGTDT